MDDNGVELEVPKVVLTVNEVMLEGLALVNFTEARINRVKKAATNKQRFKDHFGCLPVVCTQLFHDLQTTDDPSARLDDNKINIKYLLMTLHWLYRYPTEPEMEAMFDKSQKTIREWCRYYVTKIRALKAEKVVWPVFKETDIWVLYVDCIDCATQEPTNPTLSQDRTFFTFKHKSAGLRYELGTDLFKSALVWMNGPFPAGEFNDKGIFVEKGLKEKLENCGKKCIADGIYNGHPKVCSTFNAVDRKDVAKFKTRAQMRHEQFNGMIKEFACVRHHFRHGDTGDVLMEKFSLCFEAVAVICIYRMEHGEKLFDILAGL